MEQEYHPAELIQAAVKIGVMHPKVSLTSAYVYRGGAWKEDPKTLEFKGVIDSDKTGKVEDLKKEVDTLVKDHAIQKEFEIEPNFIGSPFQQLKTLFLY